MLKDGKLAADFGEFDKFCEKSFGELGVKQMYLPQISSFAFANRFSRLTRDDNSLKEPIAPYEGKYPYPNADLAKFNPDYVAELQERVKLIYSHLKQKGWQDNFLWYVCDEPHCDVDGIADMVKAYCKIVAEAEPEARLYSSTWAYTPMLARRNKRLGTRYVVRPHAFRHRRNRLAQRKKALHNRRQLLHKHALLRAGKDYVDFLLRGRL